MLLNSTVMKNRIQEILQYYQLTAAEFAKIIGVSPSGLSHILNGNRNYLSTDTIVKLTQKFPEVQLDWLILGKGSMLSGKPSGNLFDNLIKGSDQSVMHADEPAENPSKSRNDLRTSKFSAEEKIAPPSPTPSTSSFHDEKRINKVVVFYSDHTFVELYP